MRKRFFGEEASTRKTRDELLASVPAYQHHEIDIRDAAAVNEVFKTHGRGLRGDRAHRRATIARLGGARSRRWISRSTPTARSTCSKQRETSVRKRRLFLLRRTRSTATHRIACRCANCRCAGRSSPAHEYEPGISENMSIDQTKHSLFGASKVAADVLVQEYGRYFGMPTVCFRGGCLTGPAHAGTELHGFLSYLMKCAVSGRPLSRLRLQGQTGARQHSQLRPGRGFCRVR